MFHKSSVVACCLACFTILSSLPSSTPLKAQTSPPASASTPQSASAELEQGRALLKRGKASEALVHLENALKQFTAANDLRGEGATEDLLGELYERQGQYEVAAGHYQKAHETFTASAAQASKSALGAAFSADTDTYNANLMLAKMGNMYYREGRLAEASGAYNQMDAVKPDTSALGAAKGAKSTANKARGLKSRLRSLASSTPSLSTATEVTGTATDTASLVKQGFDRYHQAIIYTTHELGLGRIDYFNKQYDSAKTHFENALAASGGQIPVIGNLGQMRRFRSSARTSLGDVALSQKRYAEAIKLYAEAAKGAQADQRLDLMWPTERGLGRSRWLEAAQEKDPQKSAKLREESVSAYRDALQTLETIRQGSLRADESRTTFLATTKEVYTEAADELNEMALAAAVKPAAPLEGQALQFASEAFKITEQGRARSLLDLLAETNSEITEGVPADLLKRKQENLERQQEIAGQLTGVNLEASAPAKSVEELETELNQLQTEYDALENDIRTASPRYASLVAAHPLTLADVQQSVLDEKTALLEYSLGDEQSYLWAITRSGVALYRLPPRSVIEGQAVEVRSAIIPEKLRRSIFSLTADEAQRGLGLGGAAASTPAAAFAAASGALYKTVVEPAASLIGDKRLLIVADGALDYVPFAALTTAPPAAPTDYATLSYLVKTNEIVYAPSASVIAAVRQQATGGKTSGRSILLVADPVFDSGDPRARGAKVGAASGSEEAAERGLALGGAVADLTGTPASGETTGAATGQGVRIPRLNGTRVEAQQISQIARAAGIKPDVWLDLDASESNVETRGIDGYRVIHFATHGLLDTERPQFTGLILSLIGNRGDDGFLRTDEVFNLRLGSPLVMLSACETGLGKEKRGEGVIGLTRAFMYAGAPTVGVSLWSVADRSTADLMTGFYKRFLARSGATGSALALRDAQRDMIAGKRYSAPFYWAPFVLVGDWR